MSYNVRLDAFEGPLDLLLHLINRLEIDIYDIPMAELTNQYIEHIHAMQVLELNEASEYLVMAATLLAIKSKLLLPIHEGELDEAELDVDHEDPRDELVQRLIEYRKFKTAAMQLEEMEKERGKYFTRPPMDLSQFQPTTQLVLFEEQMNVYDMLGAFQKMMRRKVLRAPLSTRIARQEISVKDQMISVVEKLKETNGHCLFSELFPYDDKSRIIVTFLSILELMKRDIIHVKQEYNFDDLAVKLVNEDWIGEEIGTIDE
ncbi:segregation/condensation protein A [Paenisporosarcina cavernae]|uniref:Segregation and condensation protein A n=1 Tax=Paenisporosarcina cavernae TaxID=2320858 RepID=A0A385YUV8_9BACL|nr:segregation/condensation protein A [Paenisporosarcina cavernae]AYC29352.1 segregation/condensation protein A [Paenisporosarcina cavernae]